MNVSKRTDRWKKPKKKMIEDKTDKYIYKKSTMT